MKQGTVLAMVDLEKLLTKLQRLQANESRMMTNLRRTQTLFDKYYSARVRVQTQIDVARAESKIVADRLTGQKEK